MCLIVHARVNILTSRARPRHPGNANDHCAMNNRTFHERRTTLPSELAVPGRGADSMAYWQRGPSGSGEDGAGPRREEHVPQAELVVRPRPAAVRGDAGFVAGRITGTNTNLHAQAPMGRPRVHSALAQRQGATVRNQRSSPAPSGTQPWPLSGEFHSQRRKPLHMYGPERMTPRAPSNLCAIADPAALLVVHVEAVAPPGAAMDDLELPTAISGGKRTLGSSTGKTVISINPVGGPNHPLPLLYIRHWIQ